MKDIHEEIIELGEKLNSREEVQRLIELEKRLKEDEVKEEKKDDEKSLNGLFDMLTGIDIDKIADGLNGMRKVLSILGELTTPNNEDKNMNRREKPFKRDDD